MIVCTHCGAVGGHSGACPVREATLRTLGRSNTGDPVGLLRINGGYVARVDGEGGLQGGSLFADADGNVRWIASGDVTRDRSR